MACLGCDEKLSSLPPYADLTSVQSLYAKVCKECKQTVSIDVDPADFCLTAWPDGHNECCDLYYIKQGDSLYISNDCSNWGLLTFASTGRTLIFEETKTDSLSGVFDVQNIPQSYNNIVLEIQFAGPSINTWITIEMNGDTNDAHYIGGGFFFNATTQALTSRTDDINLVFGNDTTIGGEANYFGTYYGEIQNYSTDDRLKFFSLNGGVFVSSDGHYVESSRTRNSSNEAITNFQIRACDSLGTRNRVFGIGSILRVWVE